MKTRMLLLMALLIALLAGCNRGEVTDIQRNPEGGADVTVRLTEAEINEAIADALATAVNPLLRNPQVDLQAGQIVVNGEHDRPVGQGTVSGSVTITLTIQDGTLLAQITQANIEGWDASDERIARFNERLANNFSRRANRENSPITFKSVTVTDDAVEVIFNIKRA